MSARASWLFASVLALFSRAAFGQNGDHKGEDQAPLPASLVVPPAPALSPEAELATFALPRGVTIELVAAEPLVHDPVAFAFDARERLWVVEMSGYMPDVDGHGESEPTGKIVILEDSDGDGRMDVRHVFLDHLVLPRAIALTHGGALVIAPPELLFASDEDDDGVADQKLVVDRGLDGTVSPEHAINALRPTLDNAFHCSETAWRYVFRDKVWKRERTAGGGQWGASQDDLGRIFTNDNSDPLRADLIGSAYAARNPNYGIATGTNVRVATDKSSRPARMTPGVNRGYQKDFLDAQFRLNAVTAACSPWIARGDALPETMRGNAFVCEPAANIVIRYSIAEDANGALHAEPRRREDGIDFLSSTDERFRPVFLGDGPDGALYLADIYRGVIQHHLFVTSFLRKQVLERGLEKPIGFGRIWRLRASATKPAKHKTLADQSWEERAVELASKNGWRRDTAQRLFVEDGADVREAGDRLRAMAHDEKDALGRMHALWALAGSGRISHEIALAALADSDRRVRLAAIRTSESLAAHGDEAVLARWLELARAKDMRERRQVLLSLGEVPGASALEAFAALLGEDASNADERSAVLSGVGERELTLLELLIQEDSWRASSPGRADFVRDLARCVVREGRRDRVERLFGDLARDARAASWPTDEQIVAMIDGALAARPKDALGKPSWIRVAAKPASLAHLITVGEPRVVLKASELEAALAWPGKSGVEELVVRALDAVENARFEQGRAIYDSVCAQCHLSSGLGTIGTAPPLRNSPWVLGQTARVERIVLGGLRGAVELEGNRWDGEMPVWAGGDAEIAAVLTYIRREWGHGADPVTEASVAKTRAACAEHKLPWTIAELAQIER